MKKQRKNKKKFQLRSKQIAAGWLVMDLGLLRAKAIRVVSSGNTSAYRNAVGRGGFK